MAILHFFDGCLSTFLQHLVTIFCYLLSFSDLGDISASCVVFWNVCLQFTFDITEISDLSIQG